MNNHTKVLFTFSRSRPVSMLTNISYLCLSRHTTNMLQTPVLFIIFNRPDTVRNVFEVIRQVKPLRLYVACDGPRKERPDEVSRCNESKDIIGQIDWECELKTCYLTENKGPALAPYTFIKWFFKEEEKGIVLEHDCLPETDFFQYAEHLLDRFRNDERIGIISGTNFDCRPNDIDSYYFSAYDHIWGWASWRRVIDLYTLEVPSYSSEELDRILRFYFDTPEEKAYWKTIFKQIRRNKIRTWDYHLSFALWEKKMLSVIPTKNLVSNIGFGQDAVNTVNPDSPMANLRRYPILPLADNDRIVQDKEADLAFFRKFIMEGKSPAYLYLKLFLKRIGIFENCMRIKNKLSSL